MKILICDDDRDIAAAIAIYLKNEGYDTAVAHNGKEALDQLEGASLVIMDVMMPQLDGVMATMKLRQMSNIPVIMLSAKTEDADKIMGLTAGADDYMTKPFNPLELIARVKSQLRRYTMLGSKPPEKAGVYRTGGLELDVNAKTASVDGSEVRLTPLEFKILCFLMENMGRVLSVAQIYEHVWQDAAVVSDNTVAVHIRRIREKIEIDPSDPRYLKVVWGLGYKVEKYDV